MRTSETRRHLTKTEYALESIRERIRVGELKPGQRLSPEQLASELEMSLTPIREALRVLQADRLVDYRPHLGIVVAELSPATIAEIYRLRSILEPLAVDSAVRQISAAQLSELERLHTAFLAAVRSGRVARITDLNSAWHWTLYEVTESTFLLDFIRRLWDSYPWRTMLALPGRRDLTVEQHEEIMSAIRAGDAATAAVRLRDHILSGQESLVPEFEREQATKA